MDNTTFSKVLRALTPLTVKNDGRPYLEGILIDGRTMSVTNSHYLMDVRWLSGDEIPRTFLPNARVKEVIEKLKRLYPIEALDGATETPEDYPPIEKVRVKHSEGHKGCSAIGFGASYMAALMKALHTIAKADGVKKPVVRWQVPSKPLDPMCLIWEGADLSVTITLMPCRL